MRIAIVSKTGTALDAYKRFFEVQQVDAMHAATISDLYHQLTDAAINGFVVDVQTVVKATEREKTLIKSLEEIFPSIRTNWHSAAGFRALFNDSSTSGEENMIAFLQECRNFKARALRRHERLARNINVLFWLANASEETAQRAYTQDFSAGGLFVCTCYPPSEGSLAWIRLLDLGVVPFKLVVKRQVEWGVCHAHPGIWWEFY